jgi:hypothetical protein
MKSREAGPILVIAGAAVEQDGMSLGTNEPRMHAADKPIVLLRIMIGNQPVEVPTKKIPIKSRKILLGRQAGKPQDLPDAGDGGAANLPCRHQRLPVLQAHPSQQNAGGANHAWNKRCVARDPNQGFAIPRLWHNLRSGRPSRDNWSETAGLQPPAVDWAVAYHLAICA